jgi:hypothetical protein
MLTIVCFYYPECGSDEVLPARLERALEAEHVSASVSHHVISPEEGRRRGIGGSPTLLVNGRDAFEPPEQGVT